jgi:hypothetical protein
MNPDLKRELTQPIPFSPDFVDRVFRAANRKRKTSRWTRALTAGAALVIALVMVGRGSLELGEARPMPDATSLLAMSDLDLATSELAGEPAGELAAEEGLDADPDSYFAPEPEGQADDRDESEIALLGQE